MVSGTLVVRVYLGIVTPTVSQLITEKGKIMKDKMKQNQGKGKGRGVGNGPKNGTGPRGGTPSCPKNK